MNIKQKITSIIEARDKATQGRDDVKSLAEALLVAVEALEMCEEEFGVIGGMTLDEQTTRYINRDNGSVDILRKALAEIEERLK